jgi:hypothetical protein
MKGLLIGAAVMLAVLIPGVASAGPGQYAGVVKVVSQTGATDQRASGFGQTEFSLLPPAGAACQGDSANDNYRIQTFIVPAATDPGSIRYKSTGPASSPGYALYDIQTDPSVQINTLPNQSAGQPGRVPELPSFSYAVFPPGTLAPGRYHIGIACTLYNATTRYWDTDINVATAPNDKPAEVHWTLADPSLFKSHSSPIRWIVAAGLVVAALVAIVLRRRARLVAATPREKT